MIKNTLLVAWRNLWKFRTYSIITILGLSVGMACSLFIFLYVRFELSFDKFHSHYPNIYRVLTEREINDKHITSVNTSLLLSNELRQSIPEIEYTARFGRSWSGAFTYGDKQFQEPDFYITDASVLNIFDIEVVKGDLQKTLAGKNLIALTDQTARKYFGESDPIGKTITYTFEESQDFVVSAIVKPMPANSHFHFDLLANLESVPVMPDWSYDFLSTYIRLKAGANSEPVNQKLALLVNQHYPKEKKVTLHTQPLEAVHLHSHHMGELEANNDIQTVLILSGTGILLLLLASINFMNMVTARSSARAREVGVRKVFGAIRFQLIGQFMLENMGITLLAALAGLVLVELLLPFYTTFTGHQLAFGLAMSIEVVALMFLLALILGFLSSLYPAWFMSAYKPTRILKGIVNVSENPGQFFSVRKALITIQCTASLFLIVCMVVMERQINYLLTKELGFNKQSLAYIRSPQDPINYQEFKTSLLNIPGINSVTYAGRIPGSGQDFPNAIIYAEGMQPDERLEIPQVWVSHDFLSVFSIDLKEGRDFSVEFPNDNRESVLINESAARLLWNSEELGKGIDFFRRGEVQPAQQSRVVGIVSDFHFQSLHQRIQPMVIRLGGYPTFLAFRYDSQREGSVIEEVSSIWKKLSPAWPLELSYLKDSVHNLYSQERKLSELAKFFTMLAIALACFGLFGLAFFTAERKTKEIGIRKVLGASSLHILRLMLIDFSILIIVSFAIASPIAYMLLERWLAAFAYQVPISAYVFIGCGLVMLVITLATVSFQSIKASLANPVDALRNE